MNIPSLTYGTLEFLLDDRSIINITVDARSIAEDWKRCGQLVDEIVELLDPVIPHESISHVSFILNELTENTIKYSRWGGDKVEIDLNVNTGKLNVLVTNDVVHEQWESFKTFYDNVSTSSASGLLRDAFSKLEKQPLGIILLMKDQSINYSAEFHSRGNKYYIRSRVEIPLTTTMQ